MDIFLFVTFIFSLLTCEGKANLESVLLKRDLEDETREQDGRRMSEELRYVAHSMGSEEEPTEPNYLSSIEGLGHEIYGFRSIVSSERHDAFSNDFFENRHSGNKIKNVLVGLDYVAGSDYDEEGSMKENMTKLNSAKQTSKQLLMEIEDGDVTSLLGTNPHYSQPDVYPDLGRRFVLQYPYKEIVNELPASEYNGEEETHLIPKLAPPELVLAVAKESALLQAATPLNPSDAVIRKNILRSGNYWNAFWEEDVDPQEMLRTKQTKKLKSVKAYVTPDADIYELVAKLKQESPKLLYVINRKSKK